MKMTRRTILRNIYASAVSLPLYRVIAETEAFGQVASGPKALFLYYPNGNIANAFFPTSPGNFPMVSAPLSTVGSKVSFVRGLEYLTAGSHEGGAQFCFTGKAGQSSHSIDTYLGEKLGANTLIRTLRLGVGANFQTGADKQVSYLSGGAGANIQDNPKAAFTDIFGSSLNRVQRNAVMNHDKSVLDFSLNQLKALQTRLGQIEKEKLDSHMDSLRELERRIDLANGMGGGNGGGGDNGGGNGGGMAQCNASFDANGINFPDQETGYPKTFEKNEHYGLISEIMINIMVQAMSCGVTNVGLMQWSHAVSPTVFNFTKGPAIGSGHHDLSHYGGDENGGTANQFKTCQRWHMAQMASLLEKLDGVSAGGKSLLDSMACLATTELGDSNLHNFQDIPCFVAGGRIKGGQILQGDTSYNKLLVTILNSVGINDSSFGDPALGTGAISGLI
ncbi:DUF1552 domain-containing protein [Pseudobacteriovorax antillogorgiicola]|uniref:DUF1552 domain-containing protein n=1 Tax=Pseudobacteriovorax antillogorgiicola TaxID=1513793 RepID=A0A1Y6CLC2_9BACT|nr:DUF1552 domain-containing protein [Pseudobacteriovorax antillogorgiicola]TCS47930.1 uncharacterized protein DUF1552 [Pseudobacteriovorax antillogorgiicola]SMF57985.1 Protein of unknown function [Pseudobacteriovorax antillogorgiicola]